MKGLVIGLIVVAAIIGVLLASRAQVATEVVDRVLAEVRPAAAKRGLVVDGLRHGSVDVEGLMTVRVTALRAALQGDVQNTPVAAQVRAERLWLRPVSYLSPAGELELQDVVIEPEWPERHPGFRLERIELSRVASLGPVRLEAAASEVKQLLQATRAAFEGREAPMPVQLQGVAHVRVGERPLKVRLQTEGEGANTQLRADAGDVRALAQALQLRCSETEVRLMASHPLRMWSTLRYAADGKRLGAEAEAAGGGMTEDAFRHVYWSYQLTRTFGPEFAQQVTNAHEELPGNTPDERAMDYHNNAVGRGLHREGVAPSGIEKRILRDPLIIRTPDEVSERNHLLR